MDEKVPFALVCVAVLAFACGPRPRGEPTTDRPTRGTSAANVSPDAPLSPALDVAVDGDVRFDFSVVNAGNKKIELVFPDGRTHDVVVLDGIGREVWRWSEGRLFTQAVQNKVLRSSDALQFNESWDDATPGSYTAVATLTSSNFPVEQRVAFVVR